METTDLREIAEPAEPEAAGVDEMPVRVEASSDTPAGEGTPADPVAAAAQRPPTGAAASDPSAAGPAPTESAPAAAQPPTAAAASDPSAAEPAPTESAPAAAREPSAGAEMASEGPAAADAESSPTVAAEELLPGVDIPPDAQAAEDERLKALLEAIVYVTEEPLTLEQIANGVAQPRERVQQLLEELVAEFDRPGHGVTIRVVAGGYKMATKPEHHEAVRSFVKSLKAPLKLSLPALETLAVIAYKQPVTAPEIMEIRGVQGAGVLKTLLDRKLIAAAGRKNVVGKPILYKTTKEFMVQFGLKDLSELPSLKEFEEIRRLAVADGEMTLPFEAPKAIAGQPAPPAIEAAESAEPGTEGEAPPDAAPEPSAEAQSKEG